MCRSEKLTQQFLSEGEQEAFVISIDIRRSSELMLKARTPGEFAQFLSVFCKHIGEIIMFNHGVFDKFTGDGVLAYFPEFFSGDDAGLLALNAAQECHAFFQRHYAESRGCFTAIPCDVGLGIGIDFGKVALLKVINERTVVGKPVVYACRMSAAPAGQTVLNFPACLHLSPRVRGLCSFTETRIEVKHEGCLAAITARLTGETYKLSPPPWWEKALEPPLDKRGRIHG